MTGWVRVEPAAAEAGDVGGDAQVGEAWSARWIRHLPDGTWGVVDRCFYPADVGDGPYVERQTTYVICTNPHDPEAAPMWADAVYDTIAGGESDREEIVQYAMDADGPSESEWVAVIPWAEAA
jgi:hypothetical protein